MKERIFDEMFPQAMSHQLYLCLTISCLLVGASCGGEDPNRKLFARGQCQELLGFPFDKENNCYLEDELSPVGCYIPGVRASTGTVGCSISPDRRFISFTPEPGIRHLIKHGFTSCEEPVVAIQPCQQINLSAQ